MTHDRHRRLRALLAAVAPLGLIGCSGCSDPYGDFDTAVCVGSASGLSHLEGVDADYLALRRTRDFDQSPTPQRIAEWGQACATAADAAGCQSALDGLMMSAPLTSRSLQITDNYDVAFTRADEVATVSTLPSLIELLGGTIDTPNEAALVAFAAGHDPDCDQNNVRETADGYELLGTEGNLCGGDLSAYLITVTAAGATSRDEGEVVEEGDDNCAIGRRPQALVSRTRSAPSPSARRTLGGFFAGAAHLEAASISAFEQVAVELAVHGAPQRLVRAALRARKDEIRHATTTAAIARGYGAMAVRPIVGPRAVRRLFDVARDNATEGCVRETFGAVVAQAQARRAATPRLRRALTTIARDEMRHAALSWAIDDWMLARLKPRERRQIVEARTEAAEDLRARSEERPEPALTRVAGVPPATANHAMASALCTSLWQS